MECSESTLAQVALSAALLVDVPIAVISVLPKKGGSPMTASYGLTDETANTVARLCDAVTVDKGSAAVRIGTAELPLRAGLATALCAPDGARVGTLYLFDTRVRAFAPLELSRLVGLTRFAADYLLLALKAEEGKEQLAAVSAASASAIIFTRRDGTVASCNVATERLLGWTAEELVGKQYSLAPPESIAAMKRHQKLNLEPGFTFHGFESQRLTRNGKLLDVSISAGPVRDAQGNISGTVVVMDDRTERNHLREVERRLTKGLELTANDAPIAEILEHLVASVEFSIPDGICTILRCRGDALVHVASGPALPARWIEAIGHARIGPSEGSCGTAAYFGETIIVDDIATDPRWEIPRPLALELGLRACWSAPIRNARGVVHGTLAVYSDRRRHPTEDQLRVMHEAANLASIAMEAKQSRERLESLASRDTLTGLPNRAHFQDRLSQAIAAAKLTAERVYVGLLDLDRFKIVNDTFGHMVGDQLLVEVANRLRAAARPQDVIARMGGDEFLFLLTGIDDEHGAERVAGRVLAELNRSFLPAGNEVYVHASLGFSVYPDDSLEQTQLMRLADRAMYKVKAAQTRIGFYAPPSDTKSTVELPIETALNRALERGEFTLQYEPQIESDNRLRSAEAHIHWNHPSAGLLSAERFMALADEAGLTISIGNWMLNEACGFARRWKAAGGSGCVALSISARQYRERDFVRSVIDAISKAGIVPAQLRLEFSETTIAGVCDNLASTLTELRAYGIHAMLGDFGARSSNLQHLSRLPIDGVRIDGSLLNGIEAGNVVAADRAVFESIVRLSKVLHLEVITACVDTPAQLAYAFDSGCDVAQGPVFAEPMSEAAFLEWRPRRERPTATRNPVLEIAGA